MSDKITKKQFIAILHVFVQGLNLIVFGLRKQIDDLSKDS